MYNVLNNAISEELFTKLKKEFSNFEISEKYKYTEHKYRYGKIIKDIEIVNYISKKLKREILNILKEESKYNELFLSDVYLCIDDKDFHIPWHEDSSEKYISCILYCGEGFSGTSFFNKELKEIHIEPIDNKLLFFKGNKIIHCVKKSISKRYTLQFSYKYV
jgi:hypothetical protein